MTLPMHQDAVAAVLRMTMMVLLLFPLMYALSSFPSAAAECPANCTCIDETVDCSSQKLDRIPDRIPPATILLYLRFNEIRDIEPNSLAHLTELNHLSLNWNNISVLKNGAFANLSKLQILDLNANEIRDIEPNSLAHLTELTYLSLNWNKISVLKNDAFTNLSKLDTLSLGGNKIQKLDLEMFKGLTKLKTLYLSFNEIRDIEPNSLAHLTELNHLSLNLNNISVLKNGAFANLSKLQILYLHDNEIQKLDLEIFKGLTKLFNLFLHNNRIRKIPPGTFDSLTLDILQIDNNPLTCDCDILYCINVLNTTDDWAGIETCNYPGKKNLKYLRELTEDDFHCSSPDVIVVPENKTVSVGEQLQLSCKAVGDPEPFISWAKDDIDLDKKRVQVFQNNTLFISKVERTDGGQYKCVASNSRGRKSFEATVNVNGRAENGCSTMFGVIPGFFFIIIILVNCVLYNDIL